ncbi:MAG TPA: tRNA lysidine(34) synthetase TilS [Candidatus Limnocylindrales bacterium]|nr:tRNA lysidine(34) synthetase TilS [Candidatus Limnocylindrales bacterium]
MPKPNKKSPRKSARPERADLVQRLLQQHRRHPIASAGQRIGVAVSGGADSVALFLLLLELREKLGIVLSVVHFNHKLRGKASDTDEKFVAKLAAQHDLEFFVAREDIAAKSKRERANLEEVARRSRYAFFDRLVSEGRVDRIAVAHTADDQAETVIAHILRGTGLAGVAGIHPEAGAVFRPLLRIRRAELRDYLRARHQNWREDATNRDIKRTRARIRHKLMPMLEKQFQPAVVEHLCQLADLAREEDAWLNSSAELRLFLVAKEDRGEWRVLLRDLIAPKLEPEALDSVKNAWSRSAAEAMSKRMIRLLVKRVKPRSGQLSAVHVNDLLELAQRADSGKALHLPGGVEVRREYDALFFRAMAEGLPEAGEAKPYSYPVNLSARQTELNVVENSCSLRFTVIDWPPQGRETSDTGAVLDQQKLCAPLVVRNWRPGDAVQSFGHQKRHKLSRLLNEVGVSRWEKASWPVLTSDGKIAWVRGLPVAGEYAAGKSTRTGVVITEVPLK